MVSQHTLSQIAGDVRSEYPDPHGQCFPASKQLKKEFEKELNVTGITIEEVLMGPRATRRHYVVSFPASEVDDIDASGRILIDITLDQYCDEYKNEGKVKTSIGPKSEIPKVNIYPTKSHAPYTG